ncbi:unnamed protein product, partial [Didymodactylos carnosus]
MTFVFGTASSSSVTTATIASPFSTVRNQATSTFALGSQPAQTAVFGGIGSFNWGALPSATALARNGQFSSPSLLRTTTAATTLSSFVFNPNSITTSVTSTTGFPFGGMSMAALQPQPIANSILGGGNFSSASTVSIITPLHQPFQPKTMLGVSPLLPQIQNSTTTTTAVDPLFSLISTSSSLKNLLGVSVPTAILGVSSGPQTNVLSSLKTVTSVLPLTASSSTRTAASTTPLASTTPIFLPNVTVTQQSSQPNVGLGEYFAPLSSSPTSVTSTNTTRSTEDITILADKLKESTIDPLDQALPPQLNELVDNFINILAQNDQYLSEIELMSTIHFSTILEQITRVKQYITDVQDDIEKDKVSFEQLNRSYQEELYQATICNYLKSLPLNADVENRIIDNYFVHKVDNINIQYKNCEDILDCVEKRLQSYDADITAEDLISVAKSVYTGMIAAGSTVHRAHKSIE